MITRRGSLLWSGKLGDAILMYKPGDVVKPVIVTDQMFTGVVRAVDTKINKVTVAWGGGPESQHDPDELMPMPFFDSANKSGTKTAGTRRMQAEDVSDLLGVSDEGSDPEETKQTDFLADDMESLLNRQVGVEFYSAYLYFMVAAVFQSKGLVGFQAWMERQGDDEIDHAMKVYKYLVDTGSSVELPEIASPAIDPGMEVLALTRAVLDHEMKVTGDWKAIGQLAKKQDDPATCKLVQDFMNEQIEEEDAALTLHQKVQLADSGSGILLIDNDLKDRDPNAIKTAAGRAIELIQKPGAMLETTPRFMMTLNGKPYGELYYNMTGYIAEHGIPVPDSEEEGGMIRRHIGERSLSAYKAEIARANREWATKTASEKTATDWELGKKEFSEQNNIGKAKYVVNYHDGVKTHPDGSPFVDIHITHNKPDLEKFKKELRQKGYREASVKMAELEDWYKQEFNDEVLWFNKTSDQKNGGWGGVSVRQSLESRAKPKATSDSVRDKNLWKKVQKSEVPADVVAAAEKKASKTASIKAGLKELAFEADSKGCSGCEATNFLRKAATDYCPKCNEILDVDDSSEWQGEDEAGMGWSRYRDTCPKCGYEKTYKMSENGNIKEERIVHPGRFVATSGDEPPAQRTIWEEMASDSRSSKITRCVDCDKVLEMKNPKSMKENEDGAGYLCLECAKGRRGSVVAPDLRRGRLARDPNTDPQYCGNPDKHGINEPRGGGFSIMHDLADDLRKESYDFADVDPRLASLRSRRGMDFDTKKEMDDYKREHDVRPGTKMEVKPEAKKEPAKDSVKLPAHRSPQKVKSIEGVSPSEYAGQWGRSGGGQGAAHFYNYGSEKQEKDKKFFDEFLDGKGGLRETMKEVSDSLNKGETSWTKSDLDGLSKLLWHVEAEKQELGKARKSSEILIAAGKADLVDKIMQYEGGEMSDDDTVEFFQELIDSGMVHQLQGSYGRMAEKLIKQGLCHHKGQTASDDYGDRTAAETKLVCNRCGKNLPPIKGYENSPWRHCPCGGVATVNKASSTVAVSADRDLGYTVWFGKQHEDVYAKTREEAKHKGAKALGTTPDKVRVEMFDTNPRGNSTASEIDMAASRRGRLAYADPAELADLPRMTLNQIAGLIYDDWKSVNYAARPYLDAMTTLQNVSDMYMQDSGTSVVAYFLSNASSWKGEVAKAVKKELQRRIRR